MQLRGRSLPSRVAQLWGGLVLFGLSLAMIVEAGLGLAPWDVLHEGLARVTPLSIGTWVVLVSLVVLLLWVPLRQRPGFGTISNALLVGIALDLWLVVLPSFTTLPARVAALVGGVALNAVATAAYIGARMGPGPRDGLMTGLGARGFSIRVARTAIEGGVLLLGFLLGGTVGVGTIVYAVGIGPLVHPLLPLFEHRERRPHA